MKTHKNLWDEFISVENFELAAKKAVKSKKSKRQTKVFLANKDKLLEKLRQDLIFGRFKTSKYHILKFLNQNAGKSMNCRCIQIILCIMR